MADERKPENPLLFQEIRDVYTEITLRDLFAAFALAGILAYEGGFLLSQKTAGAAYGLADAMLKERGP